MNYYFSNDRIIESESELVGLRQLKQSEIDFYLQNPNASIIEIKLGRLKNTSPTLEDLKEAKLKILNQNYGVKVSPGFTHNGWVFNIDENTLSNIALQTNAYVVDDTEDSFKISDRYKVQRDFNRNGFKPFAKGFKNVIKPLMERYAEIKNQIDLAQNESELEIIDPTFPIEQV